MSLTAVQEQMELAEFAVLELEQMGCQVLSVYATSNTERARMQIRNPQPLIAWLDKHGYEQARDTEAASRWRATSAIFRECQVVWLVQVPSDHPVQTSALSIPPEVSRP